MNVKTTKGTFHKKILLLVLMDSLVFCLYRAYWSDCGRQFLASSKDSYEAVRSRVLAIRVGRSMLNHIYKHSSRMNPCTTTIRDLKQIVSPKPQTSVTTHYIVYVLVLVYNYFPSYKSFWVSSGNTPWHSLPSKPNVILHEPQKTNSTTNLENK